MTSHKRPLIRLGAAAALTASVTLSGLALPPSGALTPHAAAVDPGVASFVTGEVEIYRNGDYESGAPWIESIAFAPDGSAWGAGQQNNSPGVFRIVDGVATRVAIEVPSVRRIDSLAFAPDGQLLLLAEVSREGSGEFIFGEALVLFAVDADLEATEVAMLGDWYQFMLASPQLEATADGTVWVVVPYGRTAYRYADGNVDSVELGDGQTVGVLPTGDGGLWVLQRDGALVRRSVDGQSTVVGRPPSESYFGGMPHRQSRPIIDLGDGRLLTVDHRGVFHLIEPGGQWRTIAPVGDEFGLPRLDSGSLFRSGSSLYRWDGRELTKSTIDLDGPRIVVSGLEADESVTVGVDGTATVECDDPAGIESCVVELDGEPVDGPIDLSALGLGTHTLSVRAVDGLGQGSTVKFRFDVVEATELEPEIVEAKPAESRRIVGNLAGATGADGQVARLYMAVFQRQPDADGHAYWVSQLGRGLSARALAALFVASPEFRNSHANLDDGAFVDLLYRNVMMRSADTEGRNYWTSLLRGGLSRAEVVLWFAESAEFQRLTETR